MMINIAWATSKKVLAVCIIKLVYVYRSCIYFKLKTHTLQLHCDPSEQVVSWLPRGSQLQEGCPTLPPY